LIEQQIDVIEKGVIQTTAPPQLEPQPAVQARQWMPVMISALVRESGVMSHR
jgi:hypothetical protein